MSEPTRVLVPIDSSDKQSFDLALAYAQKICERASADVEDIILLIHTRNTLSGTSLARFLGSSAKALSRGPVALNSGVRLSIETLNTLKYLSRPSVVVAFYAEPKMLDHVDGLSRVAGVVAVPDLEGGVNGWVDRWGAIVHGQSHKPAPILIADAVVIQALETLTTVINPTTGLGHPRDKAMADQILRILRAKGHADPSAQIKSWAIRRGWRPEQAANLEALARKVWALKGKPSLTGFHDPHGRYARWKEDAGVAK